MKKICGMVCALLVVMFMSGVAVYADSDGKEYYPGTTVITYESVTGDEPIESKTEGDKTTYVYPYIDSDDENWMNRYYGNYALKLSVEENWKEVEGNIANGNAIYSRDGYVVQINVDIDNKKVYVTVFKDHDGKYEVIDNSVITVYINGERVYFDVDPQLINGRTMVPMRAIFEALECDVEWDNDNQQITATKEEDDVVTTIVMQIDKNSMMVDEEEKVLDVAPTLVDGRTLVPVRAISEALGVNVEWHNPIQAVDIYDEKANTTVLYNENDDTVNSPSYLVKKYQHAGYSTDKNSFYTIMYALDGRTISVKKSEVEAYKKVGWYATKAEVTQTVYSVTGPKTVYKGEVQSYLNQGWRERPFPFELTDKCSFEKNSVDGIQLNWWVKNTSGKTINYYYVTIYYINPVGDPAYDEITHKCTRQVNYVGPVTPNAEFGIYSLEGYVPICHAVLIGEVEIEYADGTAETIWCGQVAKKGNILSTWDGTMIYK